MESKKCKAVATRDPAMLTVNARSEIRARSSNSACFDCPAVSGGADSACIHSLAQGTGPWRRTCGRTHRPMRCGGRRRPITRRNYARSASARPRRDLRRMRTARPVQHGRIPPDRRHVPSASISFFTGACGVRRRVRRAIALSKRRRKRMKQAMYTHPGSSTMMMSARRERSARVWNSKQSPHSSADPLCQRMQGGRQPRQQPVKMEAVRSGPLCEHPMLMFLLAGINLRRVGVCAAHQAPVRVAVKGVLLQLIIVEVE